MTEAHKQLLALQQRISDLDGKKLTADEKSVLARKDELIQALTLLDVKQQELQKQTALNDLKKKTIQLTSQLAEEERAQRQQHDLDIATVGNTGAHTHSLSGSTNAAGNHSHRDGRRFNPSVFKDTYQYGYTSSGQNTWGVQGSVGMSTGWLANTSTDGNHSHSLSGTAASAGAHAHTVGIGAHTHSVAIGSHGHTITVNAAGNAENTVKNIAFNYIVRLA